MKGIGKGIVGAVAKPIVGVFDLASIVSEGIRNTTTVFDETEVERTRLPRHIPYDNVLRVRFTVYFYEAIQSKRSDRTINVERIRTRKVCI